MTNGLGSLQAGQEPVRMDDTGGGPEERELGWCQRPTGALPGVCGGR